MEISEIRVLYQSEDFVAFTIQLRGGRSFRVVTRDHIWVTPGGTMHVIAEDDSHLVFDRARIEAIHYKEQPQ